MPLTTVSPGMLDTTAQYYGFKNRIINGAMVIDQRNAGASITANSTTFAVDRFIFSTNLVSKATAQRSTTAPSGFVNSLLVTSSAATSLASGDYFSITQKIEGFNCADLAFGTASASGITISFWVRSSLTGTFGGSINNGANNRSYPFSYTISSANTWEQKSIPIAGDTSGTWATDNSTGMNVRFALAMGSTYSGTAGAWTAGDVESVTGATNLLGTNGATFYITGVQLEKGSTATSFDYRPYGTELALCQRYFEKSYNVDVAPGTATFVGVTMFQVSSSTQTLYNSQKPFAVQKRATPTMTYYNPDSGASGSIRDASAGANLTANGNANVGMTSTGAVTTSTSTTANNQLAAHYTAAIEL